MGRDFKFHTNRGAVRGYVPDNYNGKYTVIYVHGYNTTVNDSCEKHNIVKQFQDSGCRALFLVVAGPASSDQPVWNPDLPTLLHTVETNANIKPPTNVIAIGHGAAYRTLTHWTDYEHLSQIILLDPFGGTPVFTKYVGLGGTLTILSTALTATTNGVFAKKVKLDYTQVNDTHTGLVTNGYLSSLLRKGPAGASPSFFPYSSQTMALAINR